MDARTVTTVEGVTLARRGYYITGKLILAPNHLVFSFFPTDKQIRQPREIWVCYPIIERISKSRGSSWINNNNGSQEMVPPPILRSNDRNGDSNANGNDNDKRNGNGSEASSHILSLTSNLRQQSSLPRSDAVSELTPNLSASDTSDGHARNRLHTHLSSRMDHYSASHIRIQCKDFTYYSFDFINDVICLEVFQKLSALITAPKATSDILKFYAFQYKPNMLEVNLEPKGWKLYDPIVEYKRLGLHVEDEANISEERQTDSETFWRISHINHNYTFSPSYPNVIAVPSTISDNVLKYAGKFRSKQRIPAVVYRHRSGINGNVIARCAQPLVGLKIQNRSLQDEKLIGEIFMSQEREKLSRCRLSAGDGENADIGGQQPQRNLIVDLRPITNAMAQHALGAGTENIDNYRGRSSENGGLDDNEFSTNVDKIFCNIDNIHVMRDSLNKLTSVLNDLDKFPILKSTEVSSTNGASITPSGFPLLQQSLTKTQWLHRLSIILQSVDRITKSIHLNNTNVIIHCSDGWDRTSQVSALLQLCLDPYYRTLEGFMVLVEKEWVSFGFKFATRSDHGGCIGAKYSTNSNSNSTGSPSSPITNNKLLDMDSQDSELPPQSPPPQTSLALNNASKVASFLQRAATHIKNTAVSASNQASELEIGTGEDGKLSFSTGSYSGSNEKSPIFHQFLDCVYQLLRQHPTKFEFNSRFLKRLFYHHYSCQYGTFLCNSEREMNEVYHIQNSTVSVWDYFNSRTAEFTNQQYKTVTSDEDGVLFFNFTDIKWWFELYGRTDEEMNGLSNSLDRKFAKMKLSK